MVVGTYHRQHIGVIATLFAGVSIAITSSSTAQKPATPKASSQAFDQQFQSAVSQYESQHYAQAAAQLESLLPKIPDNFEVEELLGLSYAGISQDTKALGHLQTAVRLQPGDASFRTNLAACLTRLGQTTKAEEQFQKVIALTPKDYTANHNLGEFYIQQSKFAEARPFLEHAQKLKPEAYDNGYDLATSDLILNQYAAARNVVQSLLAQQNAGELHNLLARIDEKDGQFVAAANEFEAAAHLDPSEPNLFDWGTELLLHRTYEPAIDVFRTATQRYPDSAREFIGLGMTLYARGLYEDAVQALLHAADIDPSDPRCYLFLSRAYDSSPTQADQVIHRFQQYAQKQPANALAQFYYAMSLWKGKRAEGATVDFTQVEDLLKKSIALDGSLAQSHFQLGNLYADQHEYDRSLPEYLRVMELDPNLADAHYRLGTDYTHLGQKDRAQSEFAIYQKLRSEHLAEVEKERAEVQQFVYSSKSSPQQSSTPQ
jgi:tetratricopeptide (TPR) repeat protein